MSLHPTASRNYPLNDGFPIGHVPQPAQLPEGAIIDRFGSEHGRYLAPDGTPFADRALTPESVGGDESLMNTDPALGDKSAELQTEIDRLSQTLGVRPMPVGFRTNDGLNIYVADDGSYHFTFYERGKLGFDQSGSLDDLLYWYCEDIVTSQAAKLVGDRAERFKYEYRVLSRFDVGWAKRRVRELAAIFRNGQPEDISLLPDIGEAL
jgi:Tuberculosis necrotizing toxin